MMIIGAGRIGSALAARAVDRGLPVSVVDRAASALGTVGGAPGEPILVCVRTDDLPGLLPAIPDDRKADLALIQNGAIRELLAAHGASGATRIALYALVATRGDDLVAATSYAGGARAEAVAAWLGAVGVPTVAESPDAFAVHELAKLLWLACNGVLCEVHGATVGAIARDHRAELGALALELAAVGRAAWGVDSDPVALVDGMVAYSAAIPDYRASVKEWPWRNGWLRDQARRHGVPTPLHDGWLAALPRDPSV
jgi:ketopantoate reductase